MISGDDDQRIVPAARPGHHRLHRLVKLGHLVDQQVFPIGVAGMINPPAFNHQEKAIRIIVQQVQRDRCHLGQMRQGVIRRRLPDHIVVFIGKV